MPSKSAKIVASMATIIHKLEEVQGEPADTPALKAWRTMRRRKLQGMLRQLKTAIGRDFFGKEKPPGCRCPRCACGKAFYSDSGKRRSVASLLGQHVASCSDTTQVLGALANSGMAKADNFKPLRMMAHGVLGALGGGQWHTRSAR